MDCKCTVLTKLAASAMVSSTLSFKYRHFWLQKSNTATAKYKMAMVKSLHSRLQNGSSQTSGRLHGDYGHIFLQSMVQCDSWEQHEHTAQSVRPLSEPERLLDNWDFFVPVLPTTTPPLYNSDKCRVYVS